MRAFGYARIGLPELTQPCPHCARRCSAEPEDAETSCDCGQRLVWPRAVGTQRERIDSFRRQRFPQAKPAGILFEVCDASRPFWHRPEAGNLIQHLHDGDLLIVASLDRLTDKSDLRPVLSPLLSKGVTLAIADVGAVIGPDDPNALAMLDLLAEAALPSPSRDPAKPGWHPGPGLVYTCECGFVFKKGGRRCPQCHRPRVLSRRATPDPEMLGYMLTIRRLASEGHSLRKISAILADRRDRWGQGFCHMRVQKLLRDHERLLTQGVLDQWVQESGAKPIEV